ncbi:MAG: helix-turn-helix domain-containing protein [Planctomycetota bacterium]|jgi:transcriptional regulator with XRE-family HTH domain
MATVTKLVRSLDVRRRHLGMSLEVLAERSGVSLPTVQRILAGKQHNPRLSSVVALASAMGVRLRVQAEIDADVLRENQARHKAGALIGLVQGSAALEGQGLNPGTRERMVKRTVHALLAGPNRKLWGA